MTSSSSSSAEAQALSLKNEGNTLYKQRQFDQAAAKYNEAYDLHKDITYLNNLAAVYFEQQDYDKTIETCQRAIDEGRDARADFKLIAKAFGRIGSAYLKKQDYDNAIKAFQKSLTEHRTPDILAKLKEAESTKLEQERLAYIDPAKADQAREEGNKCFKVGSARSRNRRYDWHQLTLTSISTLSPVTLLDQSHTMPNRSNATPPTLEATPTGQPR